MSEQVCKNTIGLAGGKGLAADLAHLPRAVIVVRFRLKCNAVDESSLQRLKPTASAENVSHIYFAAVEQAASQLAVGG